MCDEKNALNIANVEITKNGYKLEELKNNTEESEGNFYIHYYPKKDNVLGNEAKIWVSKKDCSVIEKKFYQ